MMKKYIVYSDTDGTIFRYGSCQNKDIALQADKAGQRIKEVPQLILGFDLDYKVKLGPTADKDEVVKKEEQKV
jgi:hypothetical protein